MLHPRADRLQRWLTMSHAILTAIGTDRPGIVDELSKLL